MCSSKSSASLQVAGFLIPAMAMLLSGCVKQSDYEAVQQENQQLQARLDQANERLRQAEIELTVQQSRMSQFMDLQSRLQKSQEELEQALQEMQALQEEFDKFRAQRRSAMVGKKYPVLHLDNGKSLFQAEVTAINGDELAIRHDGGFLKVALLNSNEDLRWEACFDPLAAQKTKRQRLLEEARLLEAQLASRPKGGQTPTVASVKAPKAGAQLQQTISEQRRLLNAEYDAMKQKNPSAFRGAGWDSSRPEASPLLNNFADRRAILGISRLEMIRDAINANLRRLGDLPPGSR